MDAIIKYFSGPVALSMVTGLIICLVAFLDRDPSKSYLYPLIIFVASLLSIVAGIWGGVKRVGNQTNIYKAIGPKIRHIIHFGEEQFSMMAIASRNTPIQGEPNPTQEQIVNVFRNLSPHGQSVVASIQNGLMLNWLELMEQYNTRTKSSVMYTYQFMPYLDPQLLRILGDIEDCYHFKEIQLLANGPGPANENLEFAAGPFSIYMKLISELREYFNDNLKEYTANTPAMAVQPIIR